MVSGVSVVPALIEASETVTVTWTVTDPSGVKDNYLGNPETRVTDLGNAYSSSGFGDVTRISGDRYNGVYQVELSVSGPPGTNDLEIYARDNLSNDSRTTFEDQLTVN